MTTTTLKRKRVREKRENGPSPRYVRELITMLRELREIGEPLSDEEIESKLAQFSIHPLVKSVYVSIFRKIGR